MFAKLPQTLSAPFGLLGDEAKLAFRSQLGGISKLVTTRNISETDSYWNQYTVLFDSPSDVFSLITPHDIRRALLEAPENVATLIRVMCSRLFNLVSDHTFPSSNHASVTAFASSFIKPGSTERSTTKEVLNCLRVLQRVFPVVFEVEGETNVFELEVLWKEQEIEEDVDHVPTSETAQFVIEDDDDSENGDPRSPVPDAETHKLKKRIPSLGERLFNCLVDLLFCCGFTLPQKLQVDHYKITYVIWEKGVGSTTDSGPNHNYDVNKVEVLRLILVLLSRQIYVPPSSLLSKPSFYTLHFVQKMPRRNVLTLLCSLLNTAMNAAPPSTGLSIGSVAGKLPYNHLVFKGEDQRSTLVGTCLQVLCALLDFQSGIARDKVSGSGETQVSAPSVHTNAFRYFMMKLHRSQDFSFILDGVVGIFQQQIATMNNLLPGARKSVPYMFETVVFFWKMIELNKKFRTYVLDSDKSMDLLVSLLCYNLEIKDKPQQHGLCRALSYIIQTLSADPSFGQRLSLPIKVQVPAKWNASGTTGDFLINAVYAIIATTSGNLNSIYPALIIALANCAPYLQNLTIISSTRLVQLFTSFSSPLFLLSDEGHPRLLFFMLEIFNGVIQHHLAENPNLVYNIITAHRTFEDLGTFTLAKGLREVRRVQQAKEEQVRKAEGHTKTISTNRDEGVHEPHEEKARLLGSEVVEDRPSEQLTTPYHQTDSCGIPHSQPLSHDASQPTPPADSIPGDSEAMPVSEKAQGKMKERRSMSLDTNGSTDRITASQVGRNGFVPTQEWVTSWQQGLPLDCIMLLISELLPKVQELQVSRHKPTSTATIVDFLGTVTLKHVLPPLAPVAPRRFIWSDASIVWLTSLIWGEIYVRGMSPLGIWNGTSVRLFYVKHTQLQPRQITETVTNVVGGLLGRNTESSPR